MKATKIILAVIAATLLSVGCSKDDAAHLRIRYDTSSYGGIAIYPYDPESEAISQRPIYSRSFSEINNEITIELNPGDYMLKYNTVTNPAYIGQVAFRINPDKETYIAMFSSVNVY